MKKILKKGKRSCFVKDKRKENSHFMRSKVIQNLGQSSTHTHTYTHAKKHTHTRTQAHTQTNDWGSKKWIPWTRNNAYTT